MRRDVQGEYAILLADTLKRYRKYTPHIVTGTWLTAKQWKQLKKDIIRVMGAFDLSKTYCGPGKVGDALVPDFIFKFAGYVHDGIYKLIELGELDEDIYKELADDIFYIIMNVRAKTPIGKGLAVIYYWAVVIGGNPKAKKVAT